MEIKRKLIIPLTVFELGISSLGCNSQESFTPIMVAEAPLPSQEDVNLRRFRKYSEKTHDHLSVDILRHLDSKGVPLDSAIEYDERFTFRVSYLERWTWKPKSTMRTVIDELWKYGATPGIANAFKEEFKPKDIVDLINPNQLIWKLEKGGGPVDSHEANKYDARFGGRGVRILASSVPAVISNAYHKDFSALGVKELYTSVRRVYPDEANKYLDLEKKYGFTINPENIIRTLLAGISFEEVEKEARSQWIRENMGYGKSYLEEMFSED